MTQGNGSTPMPSAWRQAESEFSCAHAERALRVKTLSNGAIQYRRQCLTCGYGGLAIKKEDAARECALAQIPPYDETAESAWQAQQRERANELRSQQSDSWFIEHDTYLQTTVWIRRRNYVLARDNYRCQAFLPGCTRRAEQVHHLSYAHWKNEPLYELISVCAFCHDIITDMDRSGRATT